MRTNKHLVAMCKTDNRLNDSKTVVAGTAVVNEIKPSYVLA